MSVVDESLNYDIWIQNMTFQNYSSERKSSIVSFPKTFLIPSEVRTFLSSNNDKFLTLHGVKSDKENHHFIFEHWDYTLYEHIHKVEISKRQPIIRDLVDAIVFLHAQNICHTKLDPWNVMFTKNSKLKISGFSLEPLNEKLRDEDLRALGILIAFTVEDYTNKIPTSQSPWACEAIDIADKLQFREGPPSLDEVSLHPFLWSSEKHIQFYMDATALLEPDTHSNKNLRNEMKRVKWRDFGFGEWESQVPSGLFKQQNSKSKYDTYHPWCLLRFIRNILAHHPDVSKGADLRPCDVDFLGSDTSATEFSFRSKFPYFLTGLYYFLKDKVSEDDRQSLKRYYEMDTN